MSVPTSKLGPDDYDFSVMNAMRKYGTHSIVAGKYHVAVENARESSLFDDYPGSVTLAKAAGFDTVAALYITNMNDDLDLPFSHNNEWMTAESIKAMNTAIDTNKSFYLYFTPTAPHTPRMEPALNLSLRATPSGMLTEDPMSFMPSRETVLQRALPARARDTSLGNILFLFPSFSLCQLTVYSRNRFH